MLLFKKKKKKKKYNNSYVNTSGYREDRMVLYWCFILYFPILTTGPPIIL